MACGAAVGVGTLSSQAVMLNQCIAAPDAVEGSSLRQLGAKMVAVVEVTVKDECFVADFLCLTSAPVEQSEGIF